MLPSEHAQLVLELSDDRRIRQALLEQRHGTLVMLQAAGTQLFAAGRAGGGRIDRLLSAQLSHLGELVGREQHQGLLARERCLPTQRRFAPGVASDPIVVAYGQDQPGYLGLLRRKDDISRPRFGR